MSIREHLLKRPGRLGLTIHRHHNIIKSPRKNAWPYSGGVIGVDNVAGVIWAHQALPLYVDDRVTLPVSWHRKRILFTLMVTRSVRSQVSNSRCHLHSHLT